MQRSKFSLLTHAPLFAFAAHLAGGCAAPIDSADGSAVSSTTEELSCRKDIPSELAVEAGNKLAFLGFK